MDIISFIQVYKQVSFIYSIGDVVLKEAIGNDLVMVVLDAYTKVTIIMVDNYPIDICVELDVVVCFVDGIAAVYGSGIIQDDDLQMDSIS